ncbi:MAG: hypothetical protein J6K57_07020 [Alistipes sp.]|nr:hypothetical protein [Alistipes sp.]
MKALFNPFRYIAGAKALIFGLVFIVASTLLLYSGGFIQDSYIHIGMAKASLWYVGAMQIVWWLLPALLLYLCGVLLSKSKIRIIDILGTTAFAQLILLLMIAPMLLPVVMNNMLESVAALQSGVTPQTASLIPIMIYSIWSLICLVVFYIWNYNAFAVSCNVSGWKAIVAFIAVQVVVTIVGTII